MRILDLTLVVGPPYGTMLLADMGAEVIRIESTQHWPSTTRGLYARPSKEIVASGGAMGAGYPDRDPGARPWNRFALFNCHARNKRSMTIDLARPEGRALLLQLARTADGLIENNVPGTLAKLELDYAAFRAVQPDFIMISVSGMGQTGPYRHFRGYGGHFEDVLGHSWLRTYADGTPSNVAVPSDAAAGASAAFAFMAALFFRRRTGRGQYIDLSMAENYIPQLGEAFLDYTMNGRVQASLGNRSPYLAPQGVYRCAPEPDGKEDAWLALAVTSDAAWEALCRVIGRPDLAADARLQSHRGRAAHQDAIDAAISAWTGGRRAREAEALLQQAGVAAGAVLDEGAAFHDPHLRARGFFQTLTGPETGTHDYPVQLFHASRTPQTARRPPVRLGEDNAYVYRELLGFSEAEYRAWEAAGHIGMDVAPGVG